MSPYILFSLKLSQKEKKNIERRNARKNEATKNIGALQAEVKICKNEAVTWLGSHFTVKKYEQKQKKKQKKG